MTAIHSLISQVEEEVIALRRAIHQHPEPGFEEQQTAARIVASLQQIDNMEIQTGIATTGIVAVLGPEKQGPCIGLRADMDALRLEEESALPYRSDTPGLMHGCGHDGHSACLVGAAQVLGRMQENLHGPVKFIFQPAEENYGGGEVMTRAGVLTNPDVQAIFGLHGTPDMPVGHVGLCKGPIMATSRYFEITITGKGSHAAMPHQGIDPVVIGSHIICGLQSIISRNLDPLETGLISIPQVQASSAPNVIPGQVILKGTLRALSNDTRDLLASRLQDLVEHTARAHGATATICFDKGYPLLHNDHRCVDFFLDTVKKVLPTIAINDHYPPSLGAEDFAYYTQQVPGAFWWLGLQNEENTLPSLHNPTFDFNDDAIATAIRLHCELVLNFWQHFT